MKNVNANFDNIVRKNLKIQEVSVIILKYGKNV